MKTCAAKLKSSGPLAAFVSRFRQPLLPLFTVNLIILFAAMIVYGGENYSADSYGIFLSPHGHEDTFLGSYRFFGALLYFLYSFSGHNPVLNADIDVVLAVLITAFASSCLTVALYETLNKYSAAKQGIFSMIALDGVVLITATNCWFINLYTFPECIFITAMGLALCYFSIIAFAWGKGIAHYIVSGILAFCATGVYQQFISVFFIYAAAIATVQLREKQKPGFWQIVRHYLPVVCVTAASGVLYYTAAVFACKLFGASPNSRIAMNAASFLENVVYFATHQHSYLKGWGYFKTEFLTAFYLLFGLLWLIGTVVDFFRRKEFLRSLFSVLVCAAAYCSAYIPGLVSTSHTMRTMFAVFSAFALFTVGILAVYKSRAVKAAVAALSAILVVVGVMKGREVELRQKTINANSATYITRVFDAIEDYRDSSGVRIKEVVYAYDKEASMEDTDYIYIPYCLHFMMRLWGERLGYEGLWPLSADDATVARYLQEDYTEFDPDTQLIFDGDRLLLVVY